MGLVDHVLAILFGLVLPAQRAVASRKPFPELDSRDRIQLYWVNAAVLWVATGIVVVAWVWQGRPVTHLGLQLPSWEHGRLTAGLVVFLLTWLALDSWFQVRDEAARDRTRERWRRHTPFMPESATELAHSLVLVLSAGVCEEIIYRGFLIRYLTSLLGESPLGLTSAVLLPAVVFGLAHAYQGALRAAKIVALAVLLGALFLLTDSLLLPMILHALIDAAMGFFGLWLLRVEE